MILELTRDSSDSLQRQICSQIRRQIHDGTLSGGYRLPSTRSLGADYGHSRTVFLEAYDQLTAEGYLVSEAGRGTFVAEGIALLGEKAPLATPVPSLPTEDRPPWKINFAVGMPNPSRFPLREWGAALRQAVVTYRSGEMGYLPPGGYGPLRRQLCDYLLRNKGIKAREEQIYLCAGSHQALLLAMDTIRSSGKTGKTILENPAYTNLTLSFTHRGLDILPMETDDWGINPSELGERDDTAAVCITASHLFPLGTVYPIHRRMELCRMAEEKDFYIVENDYEGDFRLIGSPVPSMHNLSRDRVLHTGTFSQLLYPGVRVGYLVVPPALSETARDCCHMLGYQVPVAIQKALTAFMKEGLLARHYKKMRKGYLKAQKHFMECLSKEFGERIRIYGADTGLYLSLRLEGTLFSDEIRSRLEKQGIKADYEYLHYWPRGSRTEAPGLILGYGGLSPEEMEEGIGLLARVLKENA